MGKLYRSENRVIAGVCAGLAEEFGLEPKLVRILAVVLALLSGGIVLLAYILMAVLLPVKEK